jgi:parvulin-like peptidyl-prolyl isomerase
MIKFLGERIEAQEVIEILKKRVQLKDVCMKILHQKIINHAVETYNVQIKDEEVQAEGDKLRLQKHLEQASDTLAWLDEELISPEDWEAGIYEDLATQKLATHLFSKKVESSFNQNQHKFEQVLLYQILVPYKKLAWEIFYQIEEEEISFYHAAHLYDIDEQRRIKCGYEGTLYRHNLKPDIAALVFGSQAGAVIPPFQSEQGYHIFLVDRFIPPQLTDELYQELLDQMFEAWLASELNHILFNKTSNQDVEDSSR